MTGYWDLCVACAKSFAVGESARIAEDRSPWASRRDGRPLSTSAPSLTSGLASGLGTPRLGHACGGLNACSPGASGRGVPGLEGSEAEFSDSGVPVLELSCVDVSDIVDTLLGSPSNLIMGVCGCGTGRAAEACSLAACGFCPISQIDLANLGLSAPYGRFEGDPPGTDLGGTISPSEMLGRPLRESVSVDTSD